MRDFIGLRQRHNNKFKSLRPKQMSNGEGEGIMPQSEARRGWQELQAGIFPNPIIEIFSERQGNNITFKPHCNKYYINCVVCQGRVKLFYA